MEWFVFLLSLLASVFGAFCGVGGGVVVKPLLDAFQVGTVAQISFLSGCMVLAMSCYSIGRAFLKKGGRESFRPETLLAVGAAAGGVLGKFAFSRLQGVLPDPERAGGYQALCMMALVAAAALYMLFQEKARTRRVKSAAGKLSIGFSLGAMSGFLGIGGGPVNLMVLHYFFSMETRRAVDDSLYIILLSQLASLLTAALSHSITEVSPAVLFTMTAGGLLGGVLGKRLEKGIREETHRRLFFGFMAVILGVNAWNTAHFF